MAEEKNPISIPKILLFGLILIVLGAAVGVLAANLIPQSQSEAPVAQATPTPEAMTTVASDVYGFSVEIPVTWTAVESNASFPNLFQYQAPDGSTFEILVSDLAPGTTLDQYLAQQDVIAQTAFEGQPSKQINSTNPITTPQGYIGVEREEIFLAAGLTGRVFYIESGTRIYALSIVPGSDNDIINSPVYLAQPGIINTFTLLGTAASPTSEPELPVEGDLPLESDFFPTEL